MELRENEGRGTAREIGRGRLTTERNPRIEGEKAKGRNQGKWTKCRGEYRRKAFWRGHSWMMARWTMIALDQGEKERRVRTTNLVV